MGDLCLLLELCSRLRLLSRWSLDDLWWSRSRSRWDFFIGDLQKKVICKQTMWRKMWNYITWKQIPKDMYKKSFSYNLWYLSNRITFNSKLATLWSLGVYFNFYVKWCLNQIVRSSKSFNDPIYLFLQYVYVIGKK